MNVLTNGSLRTSWNLRKVKKVKVVVVGSVPSVTDDILMAHNGFNLFLIKTAKNE